METTGAATHYNLGSPKLAQTDVLPDWFEAYKHGNLENPQDGYGIASSVASVAVRSLVDDEATLPYLIASGYTPDQRTEIRTAVSRAHRAYNIIYQPIATATYPEKPITDTRLSQIWTAAADSIVKAVVVATVDGRSAPQGLRALRNRARTERTDDMSFIPDEAMAEQLTQVEGQKTYQRRLGAFAIACTKAAESMDSPRSRAIAKSRRNLFRKYRGATDDQAERLEVFAHLRSFPIIIRARHAAMKARTSDIPRQDLGEALEHLGLISPQQMLKIGGAYAVEHLAMRPISKLREKLRRKPRFAQTTYQTLRNIRLDD